MINLKLGLSLGIGGNHQANEESVPSVLDGGAPGDAVTATYDGGAPGDAATATYDGGTV